MLICVPQKNYPGIFPKFQKKTLTMEESFFVKISVYKPAIWQATFGNIILSTVGQQPWSSVTCDVDFSCKFSDFSKWLLFKALDGCLMGLGLGVYTTGGAHEASWGGRAKLGGGRGLRYLILRNFWQLFPLFDLWRGDWALGCLPNFAIFQIFPNFQSLQSFSNLSVTSQTKFIIVDIKYRVTCGESDLF